MSSTSNSQFYVVGGTVNPDSPSYVVRQADQELYDRLLAGDFCYVLTSRQMGKSSLMARTARRLTTEAHIHAAIVDLTQIGTERDKLSAEQWYYGIAYRILRELKLRDMNLSEWWQQRAQLPALQRLTEFFRDLLLERITGQIVIFIDEIDSTISLPFTDDFFAAIRACHNARATDAAYNRLSFVLLGVASPSDLVKDATRTPFNVGQRIELTDFTAEEAKPLAAGLSANGCDGEQILARILDWTGGHPYLTQKLCDVMQASNGEATASADVDSLVEQTFLSQTASRDDSNLNFVRDWMKGDKRLGVKVFKLYRNVRGGKPIADAPRSPVQNHLKLSGVVTLSTDKTLRVRNRVYEQVFSDQWAKKATPVDWNRRLAVASAAMLLLSIGFWYGVLKPLQQNVTPLQTALADYPGRYYDALRRYPWFEGKANELMAQFWERRALHSEGEGRDEVLLERLQALASKPTEFRRKEAALLIGNDYPNLIFTLRHGADVTAVAYSPDGQQVLTGQGDGAVQLWNAQTGQSNGKAIHHGTQVSSVAFSPDGKRLLTGDDPVFYRKYGEAQIWDAQTCEPIGKPLIHRGKVRAVAYSPDGKRVLTGGDDETARLWDAQTGQPLGKPLRHEAAVTAVAFSPDGKQVLTGSADKTARLWDAQTGQPLGEALSHDDSVFAVAFSPDGKRVLTGSDDKTAQLWDAQTGQPLGEALRHGDSVYAVAFSPDGKRVLTGSFDKTARLWDAQTGQQIGEPLRHGDSVFAVAFSPDGKRVLTGSRDRTARQWDLQTGQPLDEALRPDDSVRAVTLSPDGKRVLIGSEDGTARMWDLRTGQPLGEALRLGDSVFAVAFSPDGKRMLTRSKDGATRLCDAQTGQPLGEPLRLGAFVTAVAFSPDGKRVLTGSLYRVARQWDLQTGQSLGEALRHGDSVYAAAYSPDGKRVLTGSSDDTARLWDAETGQPLGEPLRHNASVSAVAFSPDGKRVLTGSFDKTARLWDAQTGQPLGEALRHDDSVSAVAFSPDGKRVLTQTQQWFYWSEVTENGLTPKSSRFFLQLWLTGYRFLEADGSRIQTAVPGGPNGWKIETVRFDVPEAPPLPGDPAALLQDWLRRLGLKFDPGQNYKLVPLYPVESSRTTSSPFN